MSSSLLSVMTQSSTGSGWNWLLIFIIFVVILAVALIVQTRFSKQEAAAYEQHGDKAHHEEAKLTPETVVEPEGASEPEEAEGTLGTEAVSPALDDLKKIEGIGPRVASLLNDSGIVTFAQLAEIPVDKLIEILETNKLQMMDPTSWPQQAKLAADADWGALEKLQGDLKAGR